MLYISSKSQYQKGWWYPQQEGHLFPREQPEFERYSRLGLTIAEIAEELDIDVALVNQFVANQNN